VIRCRQPLPRAEVDDAEAVAAAQGIQQIAASLHAEFADNLYICLDNLEVARNLLSRTAGSCQGL
jgi:hypothetical protein